MPLRSTKSLERNSRLSLAMVKNRAEQNSLKMELRYLEKEKETALHILQNDKQYFKLKYFRRSLSSINSYNSDTEILSKYFIPSTDKNEDDVNTIGDSFSKSSVIDFQEIHHMLFTNDEIDKEKILCLHLISAHRAESLTPPKIKLNYICKIHSPLERLLEKSKRKHIHQEQKMTNLLPIYTLEFTEFNAQSQDKDLINDGRLAARILLNEKIREIINSVLNALRQSNPKKNYEIFEMANDVSCLKKLFTKRKILEFLNYLLNSPLINSCESFILTAPFRVRSIQLEIRTISGTLETFVKQIRQNVLQIPVRLEIGNEENIKEAEDKAKLNYSKDTNARKSYWRMDKDHSDKDLKQAFKDVETLYGEKQSKRLSDPERKLGRHVNTNFVFKNKNVAANVKKMPYDEDDETDFYYRTRKSSISSTKSRRRSSDQSNIADRFNIQPLRISEDVKAIMHAQEDDVTKPDTNLVSVSQEMPPLKEYTINYPKSSSRRSSSDSEPVKYHLKQTMCPACMQRYKIPLPSPKTPRVKVKKQAFICYSFGAWRESRFKNQ
ncbi:hypothetical protein ABEB36_008794 [Hypothenemus hampei]|uniref:Uncharacterized protein n=1 Tax=Hypothenemus hampei TaxID=57062 RepID=A0ABD1EN29_HYPHA